MVVFLILLHLVGKVKDYYLTDILQAREETQNGSVVCPCFHRE